AADRRAAYRRERRAVEVADEPRHERAGAARSVALIDPRSRRIVAQRVVERVVAVGPVLVERAGARGRIDVERAVEWDERPHVQELMPVEDLEAELPLRDVLHASRLAAAGRQLVDPVVAR